MTFLITSQACLISYIYKLYAMFSLLSDSENIASHYLLFELVFIVKFITVTQLNSYITAVYRGCLPPTGQ